MVLLTNGFTVWGGPAAPTFRLPSCPYRAHTRNQKIKIGIFCQICKNIVGSEAGGVKFKIQNSKFKIG